MAQYKRLFGALASLFEVDFVEVDEKGLGKWDAALCFESDPALVRTLCDFGVRGYVTVPFSENRTNSPEVRFADSKAVDGFLRGRVLTDERAKGLAVIAPAPNDDVLASSEGRPIWVQRRTDRATIDFVSAAPEELAAQEPLRDHLRGGRFVSLVSLIHFLRDLTGEAKWTPPPLRACFTIDDANLHRLQYGHLRYPQLCAHAERHNYHVAVASIPVDSWWVDRRVARVFREHSSRLSLMIHGNDHISKELDRNRSEEQCLALLAQALKRTNRLRRKVGVSVSRTMVPPHSRCSEGMLRAMLRLEFEAVFMKPCGVNVPRSRPLAGWEPAEFHAGGLPVVPRCSHEETPDDIPLRAFLRQPLVIFGHQEVGARDFAILAERAAQINSLGEVHWQNSETIARSNFLTRCEDQRLSVRLYSRKASVQLRDEIHDVVIEIPSLHFDEETIPIRIGSVRTLLERNGSSLRSNPVRVATPGTVEVEIIPKMISEYQRVGSPSPRLWPTIRRVLTETRDRVSPLLD